MSDETVSECKKRAVDLLARREHSRLELERKLEQRGLGSSLIEAVLDDLERENLLDAARFAESYIRVRSEKGYGPRRIRFELAERGIDGAAATRALETAEIDWEQLARHVREKRFGSPPPADFAERARQSKFLDYRGFEPSTIAAALGSMQESA